MYTPLKDLTGQKFGHLTVLSRAENYKHRQAQWLCQCECGRQRIVRGSALRSGIVTSCGCQSKTHRKDLTGQKFGRLTVISQADNQNGCTQWLCQCECGKQKIVLTMNLVHGRTKSCGCIKPGRKPQAEPQKLQTTKTTSEKEA